MVRWVTPLLALAAGGWIVLLVSAPLFGGPLAALAYVFGSLVCHQIPERSFHIQGFQLPVCARCFGLYAGVALATAWAGLPPGARPPVASPARARAITAIAAIPTAATVALEWAGVWQPSNAVRALAGAPLGFVVAFVVARALQWNGRDARRPTLHYE